MTIKLQRSSNSTLALVQLLFSALNVRWSRFNSEPWSELGLNSDPSLTLLMHVDVSDAFIWEWHNLAVKLLQRALHFRARLPTHTTRALTTALTRQYPWDKYIWLIGLIIRWETSWPVSPCSLSVGLQRWGRRDFYSAEDETATTMKHTQTY